MSDGMCPLHCGTSRNDKGQFVCCVQEELDVFPTEPPAEKFNPPPDDVRARIAASVGPGREGERRE